jgi:hypothetical protein
MNNPVFLAAADPNKSLSGGLGLLVFLALAVVVVFLFRSMNHHLRKVRKINFEDDANSATSTDPRSPAPPTSSVSSTPHVAEPRKPGAN